LLRGQGVNPAEVFIDSLERLLHGANRPVLLVVDGAEEALRAQERLL
jgi:hypothetical protein